MGELEARQKNLLEAVLCVFQADEGKMKVFLTRKKTEPYKGYWILPGTYVGARETLEEAVERVLISKVSMEDIYYEQGKAFSALERMPEERVITLNYVGLTCSVTADLKQGTLEIESQRWFDIQTLPKMAYDHVEIIQSAINVLKEKIETIDILKILFPSDFTLPELKRVCENILGKELDRRNFRKKFIQTDLIEDTGYKNEGMNGRPAKLYRFKEQEKIEKVEIF